MPQTIQDAAEAWLQTTATVFCSPALCRNYGAREIKNTLFYRDPKYVPGKVPKHVSKTSTPFAEVVSKDWGNTASHQRDTDGLKLKLMLRSLFQGQVPNTPFLFPASARVFSTADVNNCLDISTMSENAHQWYDGGWLQHQVKDSMSQLLAAEAAMLPGLDRLTNNDDYGPYGHPETIQDETAAAGVHRTERGGSADTVSDDGPLDNPSLSA